MLVKSLIAAGVALLAVLLVISAASAALLGALHTATTAATASPPTATPGPDAATGAPPAPGSPEQPAAGQPGASREALTDIPPNYLRLYQQAAGTCAGLPWSVLAAIGAIESDHGRSTLPGVHSGANPAGAQGPMQFLPATFTAYDHPTPPAGADPPSPFDPADAIYAAARLLCASGAGNHHDLPAAIFAYNHSASYVRHVLTQATRYSHTTPHADYTGATRPTAQNAGPR